MDYYNYFNDNDTTKNMKRAQTYFFNKKYNKKPCKTICEKTYNPNPLYYFKSKFHKQIRVFNRSLISKNPNNIIQLGTVNCNNFQSWDGCFKPSIR